MTAVSFPMPALSGNARGLNLAAALHHIGYLVTEKSICDVESLVSKEKYLPSTEEKLLL